MRFHLFTTKTHAGLYAVGYSEAERTAVIVFGHEGAPVGAFLYESVDTKAFDRLIWGDEHAENLDNVYAELIVSMYPNPATIPLSVLCLKSHLDEDDQPLDVGDELTIVWGEEKYSPKPYMNFAVGPIYAKSKVRAGETAEEAHARVWKWLEARAREQFNSQLNRFRINLQDL
jgi:hypothetical protein